MIEELKQHHDAGCTIIIASGAYDPIAQAIARRLRFQNIRVLSTPLEMVNERATGNFAGEIGVDAIKAQRLRDLVGDGTLVAAYGDTAADAQMLEMSQNPVAVSPDPVLLKIATQKGWRVL